MHALIMVGAMWLVYLMEIIGWLGPCSGGIIALQPEGLKGILFSPLMHGSLDHIISNSLPVAALIFLLFQFYSAIARRIFIIGWIATGLLMWLMPPIDIMTGEWQHACVIGASGLIYVLASFLFFSGVLRRSRKLLTVGLLVALYYGGLIWGMIPQELLYGFNQPSRISWQSHLAGAVVGLILSYIFRNSGEKKHRYIWEFPNYYSEKDDKLWQQYKTDYPEHFQNLSEIKKPQIWDHLKEIIHRD